MAFTWVSSRKGGKMAAMLQRTTSERESPPAASAWRAIDPLEVGAKVFTKENQKAVVLHYNPRTGNAVIRLERGFVCDAHRRNLDRVDE